jgi:TolA-binding protein
MERAQKLKVFFGTYINEVMEALEFLDKLDKAAEDAAQNQSDIYSVPTDKEMYLARMELFKEKRYDEAASIFDELVIQFPNSRYVEGATHHKSG